MTEVKVWLGGEGTCEIGGRADGQDRPGVIEALLRRLEAAGWTVAGATRWQHICKYQAGAALRYGGKHKDIRNVLALSLMASEAGCEMVAFVRDRDADLQRESAIARGIEQAEEQFPQVIVIGGIAKPAIEGWILALRGVAGTDGMSRQRTLGELAKLEIKEKHPEAYVGVVERWRHPILPAGCDSLSEWLATASDYLDHAIRGAPPRSPQETR